MKKLICPDKPHDGEEWLSRLSERLESVRKLESECHFGKVNKRFAEFRKPFMCRTMKQIGHVVRTCYGIHNDISYSRIYYTIVICTMYARSRVAQWVFPVAQWVFSVAQSKCQWGEWDMTGMVC